MTSTSTHRQIGLLQILDEHLTILKAHDIEIKALKLQVHELQKPGFWSRLVSRFR
jgi:hypothetical protein